MWCLSTLPPFISSSICCRETFSRLWITPTSPRILLPWIGGRPRTEEGKGKTPSISFLRLGGFEGYDRHKCLDNTVRPIYQPHGQFWDSKRRFLFFFQVIYKLNPMMEKQRELKKLYLNPPSSLCVSFFWAQEIPAERMKKNPGRNLTDNADGRSAQFSGELGKKVEKKKEKRSLVREKNWRKEKILCSLLLTADKLFCESFSSNKVLNTFFFLFLLSFVFVEC